MKLTIAFVLLSFSTAHASEFLNVRTGPYQIDGWSPQASHEYKDRVNAENLAAKKKAIDEAVSKLSLRCEHGRLDVTNLTTELTRTKSMGFVNAEAYCFE